MKRVRVSLGERSYDILIGRGIIGQAGGIVKKLGIGNDALIITNQDILRRYGLALARSLRGKNISAAFITAPDTERAKSLKVAAGILDEIASYDVKKKLFIIALGGGVIGDLSGFIAAIYKRGIPYIQVPTTLLAQIDSAIGGKTGVDLKAGKNLVGAFYQPGLVLSDITLLKSLDRRQISTGLSEAIKYGVIKDKQLCNFLEKNLSKLQNRELSALEFVVWRCSKIKAQIVSMDEREKKQVRTILNFGHTLGHAIEAASGFRGYNHGEAVALGMLCAKDLSRRLNLISEEASLRIERIIAESGLPRKISNLSLERIMSAYYHDKKFNAAKNRLVLLKGIGDALVREDISIKLIKDALRLRMGEC